MELRQYWAIIRRRWWIPVLSVMLAAALTLVTQRPWQPQPGGLHHIAELQRGRAAAAARRRRGKLLHGAGLRVSDRRPGRGGAGQRVRRGRQPALAGQGITVPPGALQGSTQAGKLHRIMTVWHHLGRPRAAGRHRRRRGRDHRAAGRRLHAPPVRPKRRGLPGQPGRRGARSAPACANGWTCRCACCWPWRPASPWPSWWTTWTTASAAARMWSRWGCGSWGRSRSRSDR